MQSVDAADGRLVGFRGRANGARALVLAALAALLGMLALTAAPAAGEVMKVGAATVGLQPRSTEISESHDLIPFEDPGGDPVVSSSRVYAIYWDPEDAYHGNWQELINHFFFDMSESSGSLASVFAVDGQYTDGAGQHAGQETSFSGAYTDTDAYPPVDGCTDPKPLVLGPITCLSGEQIESELETFIADRSLPKGMGAIYYMLTPPGVTDCLLEKAGERCSDYSGEAEPSNASYTGSFCSYHAAINPGDPQEGGPETILYAAIPWSAGGLGDYHLAPEDQAPAYECQDGGWAPATISSKGAAEEPEAEPVEQEPNQSGRGADGSYDSGLADLIIGQIATEQQDIVTDPLMNAWQAEETVGPEGEEEVVGGEVTDLCRNFYAPALGGLGGAEEGTGAGTLYDDELDGGDYYLNNAFNLAGALVDYPGVTCLKAVSLAPSFTAPTDVNAGEIVGFDGMESNITLNAALDYTAGSSPITYPTYEWNFGDGTSETGYAPGAPSRNSPETSPCEEPWLTPCAASAYHTYQYGGTYDVTLTVSDVGGHAAQVTEPVVVSGPAPPSPPSSGGGPGSSSVSGSTGSSSSGSGKGGRSAGGGKSGKVEEPLASPVLTALVVTKSTKALRRGLKVRYSVNEQVAGRFEVLVSKRLAKRLRLAGSTASGLPKGAKPQTVIAHALLVTTRSAKATTAIEMPRRSAQRLAKLNHLKLTLRVSAHDASASDPATSTLQTVAKLKA
jgi:PKD domain